MTRVKKRTFPAEYKAECVGLVRDGEKSISAVAKDLGLSESALRRWALQSETDAGRGDTKELTTPERAELAQLRRDNRQLRMEREILKKATAFFAKESIHGGGEGRISRGFLGDQFLGQPFTRFCSEQRHEFVD